jgi:hypothetical protein
VQLVLRDDWCVVMSLCMGLASIDGAREIDQQAIVSKE